MRIRTNRARMALRPAIGLLVCFGCSQGEMRSEVEGSLQDHWEASGGLRYQREELDSFGRERITSWLGRPHVEVAPSVNPSALPGTASSAVNEPGSLAANDDVTEQMQELWARFLNRVTETPLGTFL